MNFPEKTDKEFEELFMKIINPSQSSKDSSYKFAFACFLIDFSVESSHNSASFSTIADYFLRYYWPQECNSKIKQTSFKEMVTKENKDEKKIKEFLVSKIITNNFGHKVYPESFDKIKNQSIYSDKIENCLSKIEKQCFNDVTYSFQYVKNGDKTENISPTFFHYDVRGYKKRPKRTDLPLIDLKKGITINPRAMQFFKRYHVVLKKVVILEWVRFIEPFNEGVPSMIDKIEGIQKEKKSTAKERKILYSRFKNCFYCNDPLNPKPLKNDHKLYKKNQEVEHVIPFAYVRNDEMWNFVLACKECNCKKLAALPPKEYLKCLFNRNKKYKNQIPELKRSLDKLGNDPERIINNHYTTASDMGFSIYDKFPKLDPDLCN